MKIKAANAIFGCFIAFTVIISIINVKTWYIGTFGYQLSFADILLLLMVAVLLPLLFKVKMRSYSTNMVFGLFGFFMFYAFATSFWSSYQVEYWYTFYQIAMAALAVLIPYLVSTITDDRYISSEKLLFQYSVVLSVIFLYYMTTMGERLTGLLGVAAVIHIIMIPVIAVFWTQVMQKKMLFISLVCLFATVSAVFLTGSRAGLLSLILFALLMIVRKLSVKRLIVTLTLAVVFVPLILQFASTERYEAGVDDPLRSVNIATSMDIATHSATTFIFGNGYGSIWQWYAFEKGILPSWNYPLMETEFGPIMYHPHSVFVALFAELGLVGTLPFIVILCIITREFLRSNKTKNDMRTNILGAIICTFPSLHTDLYFYKNWESSIVWLFFLFSALSLKDKIAMPESVPILTDKGGYTIEKRDILAYGIGLCVTLFFISYFLGFI